VLYSGKIVVSLLIGLLLTGRLRSETRRLSWTALLLGLVILSVFSAIPYVGFLVSVLVALSGAGAIVLCMKNSRRTNPEPTAISDSGDTGTG